MSKLFRIHFSFVCIVLFVLPKQGEAQSKENKIIAIPVDINASNAISAESLLEFKNINKTPFYYDNKKLELIIKLDKEKNWTKLYKELDIYIRNFGIQNFYNDTYWIWRYAKIAEHFDDLPKAKLLFKLVLKHHRDNIDIKKVSLHYDSLTRNEVDKYVPLEYYYELVEFRSQVDTLHPPRGVLLNMGTAINSQLSDYGPTLHVDKNLMVFTSKRNQRSFGIEKANNEDLFFSKKVVGEWQIAQELKGINSIYNEGSACLSRDGKTIYFSRCDAPDSYGNCDLFSASFMPDSTWGNIMNLGPAINSLSWESHPSLSHSEDTLYFASDRIGGFGMSDIWYSYKDKGGKWSKAQNAGPTINTRNNELSPFYHPTYNLLYFSSNGHLLNFGEFDIFKSAYTKQGWTEPKNIGPLVNGTGSEFYFTIDSESKDLYYAKSKETDLKNMDLYSFPLPMEAQPTANTKFKGSLVDSLSGNPMQGIVSIIDMDQGIEVAPKYLRSDGSFEFDLINKNNYLLIIQGDAFFRISELFFLDGDTEFHRKASPIKSKLNFESLEFANGKADILEVMYDDLDKIVNFLLDNPEFNLKISGHTDSDGTEVINQELSQKRADAIREYLLDHGNIDPSRIEAIGYGSSKPIVKEETAADKKINRRVEFEILKHDINELSEEH
ncbi:MAG: OmpA family protein [Bacteroidota bacterium]|nr:OmpA family protein [Bacteroidota bacterium]